MPTWDTYEDLRQALDLYVAANPEYSFVLVMVQTDEEKGSGMSKAHGAFKGPRSVELADEALSELMGLAGAAHGLWEVEDEDAPPDDALD